MKVDKTLFIVVPIVALVSMLGPFSIDTYLPSFISIEAEFLSTREQMIQTIAAYLMATALMGLIWGPVSDSVGRKKVIWGSLVFYCMGTVGCMLAESYTEFISYRVLQGVAASGGLVAGRAMVRDIYNSQDAQRVMAYVLMLFALAPAIAPIVGGWLYQAYGWRSVFAFLGLYGGGMLILSRLVLVESLPLSLRQPLKIKYILKTYSTLLLNPRFMAIVVALGSSFGGLFLYIAGAPSIIFDFLSFSSHDFWVLFVPITAGIIIGSYMVSKLTMHMRANKIITLSFIIMFIGAIINTVQASLFALSAFWVIMPVVIYALGVAMSMPCLGIMALDCLPKNKGAASAMQSFIQIMICSLVAGALLPLIAQNVLSYALWQMGLLMLAVLLWFFIAKKTVQAS